MRVTGQLNWHPVRRGKRMQAVMTPAVTGSEDVGQRAELGVQKLF
jgi:hypothetical protein